MRGICYLSSNEYAFVVMNLYYQQERGHGWDYDFNGSDVVVYDDPSWRSRFCI